MTFIKVDLPAPFSPTTARTSPRPTVIDTSSSARTPGNCFRTPVAVSRGVGMNLAKTMPTQRRGHGTHRSDYLLVATETDLSASRTFVTYAEAAYFLIVAPSCV